MEPEYKNYKDVIIFNYCSSIIMHANIKNSARIFAKNISES